MATGFNTQVGNGEYRLQFETDNKEYYLLMQSTARRCVDGGQTTNADRIRAMSDKDEAIQRQVCAVRDKINEIPAADVAPVVRCKDCEYSYDELSYLRCSHGVCVDCEVPPNFYCAEGKKKGA